MSHTASRVASELSNVASRPVGYVGVHHVAATSSAVIRSPAPGISR